MVSDSIIPSAAAAAKDFSKKKRANRSAKLKQCKLDARREQWLSQGAAVKNKGTKEEPPAGQRASENEIERKNVNGIENLETRQRGRGRGIEEEKEYHDFDTDSPSNSPTGSSISSTDAGSSISSTDAGTNYTGSSSSSSRSSSSSSGGCCSGSITEEEEEEADDNCLDDWEAVADALAADDDDSKQENHNDDNSCLEPSDSSSQQQLESDTNLNNSGCIHEDLQQEEVPPRLTTRNSRAWSSDDAFRPQCLPNLSKQRSFPNADRRFGHGGGGLTWSYSNAVNVPSSCPICCEDLDGTDTSFLPCLCGFRLCLFCYNRIRQVDGRCPACRKNYEDNPVQSELSDNGGCMTFRLARSYSMVARSS